MDADVIFGRRKSSSLEYSDHLEPGRTRSVACNSSKADLLSIKVPVQTKRPTSMMAKFSELPSEIQLLIFKQFDRPTLHSTVQVNEAWHHMSADLLWEEPSFGRIAKLVTLQSVQRRQYYASKIQKFKINRLSITCAFDKLVFSSLQDLRLHSSLGDPRASIHLIPYLQRAIRTLSFRGCGLDSRSLGLIASCCPALERLEMFDLLVNVEDYEFAKFVQLLSRLRELFLGGKFAASAATIMLKRNTKNLAPTLERLDLHLVGSPDPESFRMFVMNCESLQHLSIHSNPAARPLQLMTGRVLAHVLNANPLQHLSGDWLSPGLLQQIPVSSTSVQSFGKLKSLMKSGYIESPSKARALSTRRHHTFVLIHRESKTAQTFGHSFTPASRGAVHDTSIASCQSDVARHVRTASLWLLTTHHSGLEREKFVLECCIDQVNLPSLSVIEALCSRLRSRSVHMGPTQTVPGPLFPNLVSLYLGSVTDMEGEGLFTYRGLVDMPAVSMRLNWLNTSRAQRSAERLLRCVSRLEKFGMETTTETGSVVKNVLVRMRPCKGLRAGDVAEIPITIVEGPFFASDFMRYP
ncbi:hypothetical protein M436DRAFT_65212 [Aureobasidium namibiae CBS 147.97]|uniref:F-box domain-containing protein n=1 Tax=Aureobasidium namibiae CBS 147.97 TaxID=1043004 RepID=A0A074XAS4_9PEZI|nr:uncharacterized protein M436DRAFT_65212 [Aureobasidium namibiae CBS 147.97]KEQ71731.1 hypothetical protein M436DRAFT_65212 [Aureobasidium namibiae CBS 147.97]